MDFLDHLQAASNFAGAGFYFEEGGCAGFAIALHEELEKHGAEASLLILAPYAHAVVQFGGECFDYSGLCAIGALEIVHRFTDRAAFTLAASKAFGWELAEIESDALWAKEIVQAAVDIALDLKAALPDLIEPIKIA